MSDPRLDTDFAEVPAIVLGGQISICDAAMRGMDRADLRLLAKTLEGQLVWVKRRIIFEELEVPLCTREGCWRPASSALYCSDHGAWSTDKGSDHA